jgi:parvulin-like peptidyl-prolyl isomerase
LEEARDTIRSGLWRRASDARQAELRAELLREAAPAFEEGRSGADDSTVATWRGGRITLAELRWLAAPSPVDTLSAEGRRALLEEQIVRRVAAERARARGLDRDRTLRARAAWQRATLLATEEIARRLNLTLSPPTEAEMRAHYARNRERYVKRPEVDVSVILWSLDPKDPRPKFAEAEAVLDRIRSGELGFADAARQVSTHASAAQGGRLGFLRPGQLGQLGPNVFRMVQDLAPSQTSGLVQQDDRLWIVKLWDRRPERPMAYEEAAQQIELELGDARVAALRQAREADARRALELKLTAPADPIVP